MIYVIDCGTSWLEEIKQHLVALRFEYKVFNLDQVEKCDFGTCSGIIISGAPTMLTQVDLSEYKKIFKFIKTVHIPILGICLGHQIMGILHGSEISGDKMIDKKEKIEIVRANKIFSGVKNDSLFREEHSEFITLPSEFYLLAKSKSCDNEAMKHKNKLIYGVQFHPEVSDKNGRDIFKNFLNLCSKQ